MSVLSLPHLHFANAHFVTPQLLVGGDLATAGTLAVAQLDELVAARVTHIADVRIEYSDADFVAAAYPHLKYLHHGIDDAGQGVPASWFDATVGWVLEALTDPDARVLVHCHMGINRGPSLGFAVLLAQGWDPVEALTAIREVRPIAFIAYAEDALAWHLDRTAAKDADRRSVRARVVEWRRTNHLDLGAVIRQTRQHLGR